MLKKEYPKGKNICKVTFYTPKLKAESVHIVGELNNWDAAMNPMQKLSDGRFKLVMELEKGQDYQYRFLIDFKEWTNDPEADYCVRNDFGSENCVVKT